MRGQFPRLETERLILGAATVADAEDVFSFLSDEEVCRYIDKVPLQNLEQAAQMISGRADRFARGTGIRWGIALKEDGRLVGSCGYTWNFPQFRAEVGYELARSCWRQGIMLEALTAILVYAFDNLGVHRVEAQVMPGNVASARLLATLGFREEGLLRQRGFWKGEFHDLRMFSLLNTNR